MSASRTLFIVAVTIITLTPVELFAKSQYGACVSAANRAKAKAETRCSKISDSKSRGQCRKRAFQTYKNAVGTCRKKY